jgi:hypothetical protein
METIASGIKFNNYNPNDGELKFISPVSLTDFSIDDIPYFGGVVNGVEIDWNSAELPNVTLDKLDNNNTVVNTGHLMALINDMQGQINAIAAKLAELQ